ncbi:outer membrane protein [Ruegeria sp. HKCCD6604]|uniref:outer membrane protein n=1 Tax=Ruegeria sp. HKCCD6604 TaxID=2683000 RepID=UPI00209E3A81|nr:porin family protein [Ruegeria sp. HKCCD6604]
MACLKIRCIASSFLVAATMLPGGSTAVAQDSDWSFSGSFYIYAADTKTTIGSLESELSFSEAVENLDLAFMGTLEARSGRWSLIADYMRTDLSFDNDTPGPVFSGAETSLKTQFLSGYAAYTAYQDQNLAVDLGGGFRWFETSSTITLVGGPTPAPSSSASDDWIDPLIAARIRYQINDRWSAVALADYGGFRSDRETAQFLATVGYAIAPKWNLRAGYRHIMVDKGEVDSRFKLSQFGPVLGVTYSF